MDLREGLLSLPRFKIESSIMDLKTSLVALGIPLFNAINPVISTLTDNTDPLYITDAVQKAVIDVDEKGATAAAVTVMAIRCMSALVQPETPAFEMRCDHPFVFILTGDSLEGADHVLFTGIVCAPDKAQNVPCPGKTRCS